MGSTRGAQAYIAGLQNKERERTGIKTLKVGYNKVFGYYIEVSKSYVDQVPDDYVRRQTLVGGERYITPEMKEYESRILSAQEGIAELEIFPVQAGLPAGRPRGVGDHRDGQGGRHGRRSCGDGRGSGAQRLR